VAEESGDDARDWISITGRIDETSRVLPHAMFCFPKRRLHRFLEMAGAVKGAGRLNDCGMKVLQKFAPDRSAIHFEFTHARHGLGEVTPSTRLTREARSTELRAWPRQVFVGARVLGARSAPVEASATSAR
jgi:hypothetical protein